MATSAAAAMVSAGSFSWSSLRLGSRAGSDLRGGAGVAARGRGEGAAGGAARGRGEGAAEDGGRGGRRR
ncbi:hypothetical protein ACIRQF_35255 [Streptomyces sp. NPDC101191]|uniref:hypothetical protein n=1 Tax=Streptomyces sp. NPDC101191 TaxID=3366126 RepID=UPI003816C775